jgi:hypothetical protein
MRILRQIRIDFIEEFFSKSWTSANGSRLKKHILKFCNLITRTNGAQATFHKVYGHTKAKKHFEWTSSSE